MTKLAPYRAYNDGGIRYTWAGGEQPGDIAAFREPLGEQRSQIGMATAVLDPDDEPGEDGELESSLEDTLNHYHQFLQVGEGKTYAALAPAYRLGDPNAASHLFEMRPRRFTFSAPTPVGTIDQLLKEKKRSLQVDSSGEELAPIESLEKQRELLSKIVQELVGQREDARHGEADAIAHQQRALRIAAWSLGVAALALFPPILEIALKLLGMDL